jgi:hypothetical protein
VSAHEARKQRFLGIVSSFSEWVAGFPQGFRLREGSIVLSTETGIECFGAAFWKSHLLVECGWPFFRAHAQGDSQANEDRTYV